MTLWGGEAICWRSWAERTTMTRSTCVSVPLVSVDGTAPEAQRVDPERRTPPTRKSRSPRLDTGPVRAAIGRDRRPERAYGQRVTDAVGYLNSEASARRRQRQQREADHAGAFRGELQSPRSCHG